MTFPNTMLEYSLRLQAGITQISSRSWDGNGPAHGEHVSGTLGQSGDNSSGEDCSRYLNRYASGCYGGWPPLERLRQPPILRYALVGSIDTSQSKRQE